MHQINNRLRGAHADNWELRCVWFLRWYHVGSSAVRYFADTCEVLLRTPHIIFYIFACGLICRLWRAKPWYHGGIQLNHHMIISGTTYIQMERVKSALMQLGRWDFIHTSMTMFTVADTVAIATHLLRSSALLWLLASFFVLCTQAGSIKRKNTSPTNAARYF